MDETVHDSAPEQQVLLRPSFWWQALMTSENTGVDAMGWEDVQGSKEIDAKHTFHLHHKLM